MHTTKPTISTHVGKTLYRDIRHLACQDGVSISVKARSLLREAVELAEDDTLIRLVEWRRMHSRKSFTMAEVKNRKGF